jgi:cobalt/nickel transport system permease protein
MFLQPEGISNNLVIVGKVFLSLEMVTIFNHTTQWNHITTALRKLHLPGIFIFTLDITLKYIVLLGTLIEEILTSLTLRSVGKNNKKYQSIGGVMGVTFVRGTEMSQEMYEAMRCRGFTDDYKGL